MSPAKGKKDENATSVTLHDGKASIKQKPLPMDKLSDTMQEIVRFRDMCEKAPGVLEVVPDEHLPLIAKLAHESTMLQGGLARNIRKLLLPDAELAASATSADRCPLSVIEKAITTVAERVNYGIDDAAASLCEWRWEVKDLSKLPEDLRAKLEARRADRIKGKATLRALFDALPAEKREELLKKSRKEKGKGSKLHVQDVNQDAPSPAEKARSDKETTPAQVAQGEENRQATASEKKNKPEADPAKAPKDAAKKVAKAKEKEDTKKSAAVFASFFKKPSKDHAAKASISGPSALKNDKPASDFDATFHPFTVKKDATLAPVNRFITAKYRQECQQQPDIIELNDNGVVVIEVKDEEVASSSATPAELLKEFVSRVPAQYRRVPTRPRGLKAISGASVKDVMDKLNDAEEEGDEAAVSRLLRTLKDRKRFPIKLLQYHEDVRPAYWGTWTKSSASVGPRTPFAQDSAVLNYEYDSEEDWEEEPEEGTGEAIDDAMSVDSGEEDDDDADSWLAADDEIEEIEGSPPPLDDDPFLAPSPTPAYQPLPSQSASSSASKPLATKKRKAATSARDDGKKKRKVVPLIPWIKGPYWEGSAAKKEIPAALRAYRLRLLNDTPCAIDPFTWVSGEEPTIQQRRPPAAVAHAQPANNPVQTSAESSAGVSSTTPTTTVKKAPLAPSTVFPEEHLPYLLEAVTKHEGPLTVLCEKVYQDLRAHRVFKNCIEKKIRDISERKGRRWVVKPEAWLNAGVVPPQPS